jgi:hypothetical protein
MSIIGFLIALICLLIGLIIFTVIFVLPIVLVVYGLVYFVLIRPFGKNQVKFITKGYRIPYSFYIELFALDDEAQVKLVELARTSKKHKKMFKEYVLQKTFWSDYFDSCRICWCCNAWSLLNGPLYEDLLREYEQLLDEINKSERKKSRIKKRIKSLFHID